MSTVGKIGNNMEIKYLEPGNVIPQECPFCGRIIQGIGPIRLHQKACKRKLCEQCCRPKNMCPDKTHNYLIECGERFDSKEYWEKWNTEK